jgi:hypothetical protein
MVDVNNIKHQLGADDYLSVGLGLSIEIEHLGTGNLVMFKGYVTSFKDTYTCEWKPTPVYGRMDPIMTYGGTKRNVTIGWEMPAASVEEAMSILSKIEVLTAMLYPVYDRQTDGVIQASPLMRIRYANLLVEAPAPDSDMVGGFFEAADAPVTGPVAGSGVVGAVKGFTFSPIEDSKEAGYFMGQGRIYPKVVKANIQFDVIHTNPVGWNADAIGTVGIGNMGSKAKWRGANNFPYGQGGLQQDIPGIPNSKSSNVSMNIKDAKIAAITGRAIPTTEG